MSPRPGSSDDRRQPAVRWDIGEVLARTDLARLLDDLTVPGPSSGRSRRWHCPIATHDDHHPSVTVHTDHRGHERWRCWSGDDTHRGDAIDLVTATQPRSRPEAVNWLAERAGMLPDRPLPPLTRRPRPSAPPDAPLDPAVVRYVHACEKILWSHTGAPVRDWLHRRGFDDELLRANHVGADPGRTMMSRQRGLPHGHSLAATFPALGPEGAITYVQARYLDPGIGGKYDNPAARLGANPRVSWARGVEGRGDAGLLVVTEGIPDSLTAAAAGLRAVAILGSQVPDDRVAGLLAHSAATAGLELVAVVDADPAGRAWGQRLRGLLTEQRRDLTIIEPPGLLDLNGWALLDAAWADRLPRAERRSAVGVEQSTVLPHLDQHALGGWS